MIAEGARLDFSIDAGRLAKNRKALERVRCYALWFKDIQGKDYSRVIAKGLPLRQLK